MSRTVVVNSAGEDLLQTIRIGPHRLQSDEPNALGNDGGPSDSSLGGGANPRWRTRVTAVITMFAGAAAGSKLA
jgi:hypothetical protein